MRVFISLCLLAVANCANHLGLTPLQIAYQIEPLVDLDGDGLVTVPEMTGFFENHFDIDHNGHLMKDEFSTTWSTTYGDDLKASEAFFDHLDTNRDGEITYWDLFTHFLAADTNADWNLQVSELLTFLEQNHPHYVAVQPVG